MYVYIYANKFIYGNEIIHMITTMLYGICVFSKKLCVYVHIYGPYVNSYTLLIFMQTFLFLVRTLWGKSRLLFSNYFINPFFSETFYAVFLPPLLRY